MKKPLFLAACLLMAGTAIAQQTQSVVRNFTRTMPCTNGRGEVIAQEVGTVCLPYAPTLVEGATLYELYSASADEWVFVAVDEPQANTPYVYRVNDAAERVIFYGEGTFDRQQVVKGRAAGREGAMVGSYRSVVMRQPLYYLAGDKVRYTDQPVNGAQFRCYFTTDVMPVGETLSDDVRLTFTTPTGIAALQNAEAAGKVVVEGRNIGLRQGEYQMGGKQVLVK